MEQGCLILFATQAGDAEELAVRVWMHMREFDAEIPAPVSVRDYVASDLASEKRVLLFIVSTAGDGVVPEEMRPFWRILLNKNLSSDALSNLRFCVIGLGDSGYDLFNAAARKLETRLSALGAEKCQKSVLCDASDPSGTDKEVTKFLVDFPILVYGPNAKKINRERQQLSSLHQVHKIEGEQDDSSTFSWSSGSCQGVLEGRISMASVLSNACISDPSIQGRDVRHIQLSAGSKLNYAPGSVAYIHPRNHPDVVEAFLKMFGLDGAQVVRITSLASQLNVAPPCSIREVLYGHFDLSAAPSRRLVEQMAKYAENEAERERLLFLASEEGGGELYDYTITERRSIAMLFRDFQSVRPSFESLLALLPRLRPRAFSLASSASAHEGQIHLCAALVQLKSPLRNVPARLGVCSAFLSSLKPGDRVPFRIAPGTIAFPKKAAPMIMVGPGTGIAPFRSYLHELLAKKDLENERRQPRCLFFGCRRENEDFLFQKELEDLQKKAIISTLVVAFSREEARKVYVQDKITEHDEELSSLLKDENLHIYVAGSSGAMPKAVRRALCGVLEKFCGLEADAAKEHLRRMVLRRTYQEECW